MVDDKWWTNGLNFTKSEKIRFINLIKERPGLWNYKLSYQHKYQKTQECIDLKTKLWHEIVDIYGGKNLTGEERDNLSDLLQRKWRNLRDSYVKYFKSDNEKYKVDPLYLTFSSFLDDITSENMKVRSTYRWKEEEERGKGGRRRSRKGKNNVDDKEKSFEDDEGSKSREIDDEGNKCREIDVPIELDLNEQDYPFHTMLEDSNGGHLETSSSVPEFSTLQQTQSADFSTLQHTQSADELDECEIFGQFIAAKLRKMNPQTRSRLQFLIHQTIFNDENNRNDKEVNSKQN